MVKAFAAEDEERKKFAKGNKDFEQIKTLGYYAMGAFNTSTRLFDGLMYLVVILAGGLSLVNGKITAGDLVAYMLYVTMRFLLFCRSPFFNEQYCVRVFRREVVVVALAAVFGADGSENPGGCYFSDEFFSAAGLRRVFY